MCPLILHMGGRKQRGRHYCRIRGGAWGEPQNIMTQNEHAEMDSNGFSLWNQEICLVSLKCLGGEEGWMSTPLTITHGGSERGVVSEGNSGSVEDLMCFLWRRLFGVRSGVDSSSGRWLSARSWVRTAAFPPAGCWRLPEARAGTWTWTGRAARLHTNQTAWRAAHTPVWPQWPAVWARHSATF